MQTPSFTLLLLLCGLWVVDHFRLCAQYANACAKPNHAPLHELFCHQTNLVQSYKQRSMASAPVTLNQTKPSYISAINADCVGSQGPVAIKNTWFFRLSTHLPTQPGRHHSKHYSDGRRSWGRTGGCREGQTFSKLTISLGVSIHCCLSSSVIFRYYTSRLTCAFRRRKNRLKCLILG